MNELDLRAVVLLLGAIGVLTAVVLLHLWQQNRSQLEAAVWWGVGPLSIFAGTVLLGLRGLIGAPVSIVLGNGFILAGAIAMYLGSCRFWNQPLPRWPWVWLALVALLALSTVWPHYPLRLTIVPGLMAVVQLAHWRLIWRHDRHSFGGRFLIGWLAFCTLALAFRVATAHLERVDADLFTPSIWQNIYLASYAFSLLGETIGLVLLGQQRLHAHIRELATQDSLTGIPTRTAFWEAAVHELQRQQRTVKPAALLMLDLDHFKRINDTYGHQTGDAVLRDFGQRLKRVLRATDRLGRYGGEEFIALLPETPVTEALAIAERIRTFPASDGIPPYTVSIGLTAIPPTAASSSMDSRLESAIGRADAALYQAKALGRDQTVQAALSPA